MRPEVQRFAEIMEAKLVANDHKPGWKGDSAIALLNRLWEESNELGEAIAARPYGIANDLLNASERAHIAAEAADVANFAMMIADVCGGLAPTKKVDRG